MIHLTDSRKWTVNGLNGQTSHKLKMPNWAINTILRSIYRFSRIPSPIRWCYQLIKIMNNFHDKNMQWIGQWHITFVSARLSQVIHRVVRVLISTSLRLRACDIIFECSLKNWHKMVPDYKIISFSFNIHSKIQQTSYSSEGWK